MQRWKTDESITIEDEKTIRCRGAQVEDHKEEEKRWEAEGQKERRGKHGERLNTMFFGMLYFLSSLVPWPADLRSEV